MPMYEFRCGKCDARFEELVYNARDEKAVVCPECGSPKVSRALSSFAISMKGGSCAALPSCPSDGSPCCASGRCPHS